MVLRIVHGDSSAMSFPVDISSVFFPGMIGQLYLQGNNIVLSVSDGTCPIGVIDDIRSTSFHQNSIDEVVIAEAVGTLIDGKYVSISKIMARLENSQLLAGTFMSDVPCTLYDTNGVIEFPTGTELNHDSDGDGIPDSIRAVVSYCFRVPGIAGDDSTMGSSRVSVHMNRMIFLTDQFEPNCAYPLNAPLFCSQNGKLTTSQWMEGIPSIAICIAPPTARDAFLGFLWL